MKAVHDMSASELMAEAKRRQALRDQGRPLLPGDNDPDLQAAAKALRVTTHLDVIIHGPPRTKKNSTTNGQPSRPFVDYKKIALEQLRRSERGSLYGQPYNVEAHYYVDRAGERADLVGLLQATCDILENAGVIEDDNWFRGFDRCRIHTLDEPGYVSPRVEITITPL